MPDSWRTGYNDGSPFRQRVDALIADTMARQKATGLAKYGPDFVGDPETHAIEELIGAVTYLATMNAILVNAQAHLRQQIGVLQDRLQVRQP